jgi:carboxyl-terminal processing protease
MVRFQYIFSEPPAKLLILCIACALAGGLARAAAAADPASAPAGAPVVQPLDKLMRARMQVLLKGTATEIRDNYYDPSLRGLDFRALEAQARTRIEQATGYDQALAAIADLALQLDDSHTHFYPPFQTVDVHYGWTWMAVGETAFVDLVFPGSDAERQGVHRGDRVLSINGFPATRASWFALSYIFNALRPQPGLHVELTTPSGTRRELDLAARFKKVPQVLDATGDNGRDNAFFDRDYDKYLLRSRPRVVAIGTDTLLARIPTFSIRAERLLAELHALGKQETFILDLRGNHGGSVITLRKFYGLLVPDDVLLATQKERTGDEQERAEGKGRRAFKGRVFVLVDSQSASASEVFARALQLQERGTVIGDRTAGALMLSRGYLVEAFGGENAVAASVSVTVGDVVMADGGRLEKKGVLPDFEVLPTAADMAEGRDPALALALKFAGHPTDPAAAWKLLHDAEELKTHADD